MCVIMSGCSTVPSSISASVEQVPPIIIAVTLMLIFIMPISPPPMYWGDIQHATPSYQSTHG